MKRNKKRRSKRADFDYWKKIDSWTLMECVYLLYGLEPPPSSHSHFESVKNAIEFVVNKDDHEKIKKTFEVVIRSSEFQAPEGGSTRIKPHRFIKWAASKNYELPEELRCLESINDDKKIFDVPYLDETHTYYSKEPHITVLAWKAIFEKPVFKKKRTVKGQIRDWLDKNYNDKEISNAAKERIATLINPPPFNKGGAPKTIE